MSRLKKYHLPHDGYKWRSDGRDKKWPHTTKIYYKCISVDGCPAKLHFYPHTKEIQYVGDHNHANNHAPSTTPTTTTNITNINTNTNMAAVAVVEAPVVTVADYERRPVRRSTRRQRQGTTSFADGMLAYAQYLGSEGDEGAEEEEEDDGEGEEEEYCEEEEEEDCRYQHHAKSAEDHEERVASNHTSTSPVSSDTESWQGSRKPHHHPHHHQKQQKLFHLEEDVAILLGGMHSSPQLHNSSPSTATTPTTAKSRAGSRRNSGSGGSGSGSGGSSGRKRKGCGASDDGGMSPYTSEVDDDEGSLPSTDNKCPHCGKVFQNRSTFVHHWRVVVQREQQRDCPICHEIISTWYNMKRHLGNVHKLSIQQIENERARIIASPQLGGGDAPPPPPTQEAYLQVPQQQQRRRKRQRRAEEEGEQEERDEEEENDEEKISQPVKMEVVSADEYECDERQMHHRHHHQHQHRNQIEAEADDAEDEHEAVEEVKEEEKKHESIRSRRSGGGFGKRLESMLERLMGLYERDREELLLPLARAVSVSASGPHTRMAMIDGMMPMPMPLQIPISMKVPISSVSMGSNSSGGGAEALKLREERIDQREREVEQQRARLKMREEALLLRERQVERLLLAMTPPPQPSTTSRPLPFHVQPLPLASTPQL